MQPTERQHYFNLVKGAIFGQAIGDALGHPIEFQKTHQVIDLEDDNKFTDDTQMFCAIGEAMLEAPPHKDVDRFMEVLSAKFIDWRHNPLGGTHRAPGGTCMEAVRKLGAGKSWQMSGATGVGKGNGSAMRAGIVGARYWKSPAYAFRVGCLTSIPTHNNLESILAAGMVAYLVASAIAGRDFEDSLADGLELCAGYEYNVPGYPTNNVQLGNGRDQQSPWKVIMQFANAYIRQNGLQTPAEFLKTNGNDFTAVPAVAEAIYFNSRHDDFDQMTLECANWSDDSDTITAITGTIAGARFGFETIEHEWRNKIELRDYLESLSKRIFEASIDESPEQKEERQVVAVVERVLDIDAIEESIEDDTFGGVDMENEGGPSIPDDEEFEVEF